MDEDQKSLEVVAELLEQFQRGGCVHVIMLCERAVGHMKAYHIRHANELSSPGLLTASPGANQVMARNLAFALKRHATNLGYTVDESRQVIHVDEDHTAAALLDFFTLIVMPAFKRASTVFEAGKNNG